MLGPTRQNFGEQLVSKIQRGFLYIKEDFGLILDIPPPPGRMNLQRLHFSKPDLISSSQVGLKNPLMINDPWLMEGA